MENAIYPDELQHWGIKGMKWGVRRYQNSDGSLTPAGQKRYNDSTGSPKPKVSRKVQKQRAANLEKARQAKADKKEQEKLIAEKREKLLKSTDAKEIYENRHLLTYNELNDRINRIDMEAKLQSRIVEDKKRTGMDYIESAKNSIDKVTNLYRSIDSAYSAVASSSIGKTLAKQLGIETPKKEFDLNDFVKNINKKSSDEIKDVSNRLRNETSILNEYNKRENKKKADADYAKKVAEEKAAAERTKAAQKAVDDYNKRWSQNGADDKVGSTDTTYRKSGDDIPDNKTATGKASKTSRVGIENIEKVTGTVEGKGTSTSSIKNDYDNGKKWWDTNNVSDTVDYNSYVKNNHDTINIGQNYINGYLEDKRG